MGLQGYYIVLLHKKKGLLSRGFVLPASAFRLCMYVYLEDEAQRVTCCGLRRTSSPGSLPLRLKASLQSCKTIEGVIFSVLPFIAASIDISE